MHWLSFYPVTVYRWSFYPHITHWLSFYPVIMCTSCLSIHNIIHGYPFYPVIMSWIVLSIPLTLPLLMTKNVFFAIIPLQLGRGGCGVWRNLANCACHHACIQVHIFCIQYPRHSPWKPIEFNCVVSYHSPQHEMVLYNANDVFFLYQHKHEMGASILALHHQCYTADSLCA